MCWPRCMTRRFPETWRNFRKPTRRAGVSPGGSGGGGRAADGGEVHREGKTVPGRKRGRFFDEGGPRPDFSDLQTGGEEGKRRPGVSPVAKGGKGPGAGGFLIAKRGEAPEENFSVLQTEMIDLSWSVLYNGGIMAIAGRLASWPGSLIPSAP